MQLTDNINQETTACISCEIYVTSIRDAYLLPMCRCLSWYYFWTYDFVNCMVIFPVFL